jgi:hypothetical protein
MATLKVNVRISEPQALQTALLISPVDLIVHYAFMDTATQIPFTTGTIHYHHQNALPERTPSSITLLKTISVRRV